MPPLPGLGRWGRPKKCWLDGMPKIGQSGEDIAGKWTPGSKVSPMEATGSNSRMMMTTLETEYLPK